MGQEFFINDQLLEDKIRTLLPSQGGAGAGFDLSASTQIIPVIDLTETAEGSVLRQDLQTSLSHASLTTFSFSNALTTIISNTGYYRIFGNVNGTCTTGVNKTVEFRLNDGATNKRIEQININGLTNTPIVVPFDFNIFLPAGNSFIINSNDVAIFAEGCARQIATVDGTLVNPN